MRRTMLSILALISILFILAGTTKPALATNYDKIGVRPGDWVDYSVHYDSSLYASKSYNRTHVDVYSAAGTNVTLLVTYFYPNQTSSETYNVDVSSHGCFYLTVAGLMAGDPVYLGADAQLGDHGKVSETIVMTILGSQRFVNVVELSTKLDAMITLYYDQVTGILVRWLMSSLAFGWMTVSITSTSVLISLDWAGLWLGIGFASVTVAIIAMGLLSRPTNRYLADKRSS